MFTTLATIAVLSGFIASSPAPEQAWWEAHEAAHFACEQEYPEVAPGAQDPCAGPGTPLLAALEAIGPEEPVEAPSSSQEAR